MKTTRRILIALITGALLVTAYSGLVLIYPRLFPLLGDSLITWRTVHGWSALVFGAAVVVHLALNWRRVVVLFTPGSRPVASKPSSSEKPAQPVLEAQADAQVEARAEGPDPTPGHPRRLNRRRFLVVGGVALAGAAAALALERGRPRPSRAVASSGDPRLADFPVLNVEQPPTVAAADWEVIVDGLVNNPLRLDRAAWLELPRTKETRDFHCVEGWSVDGLGWEGVRVADVLRRAQPQPQGQFVTFHAYGGTYLDSLPMAEATAAETLLADRLDGKPLPTGHGGPLRLVIPSQLGYKNVKWVVRVEVTADRAQGYWERNGYPAEAPAPS